MRYTVILFPDAENYTSVLVPAMPGCVTFGGSANEAITRVREAMNSWIAVEAEQGRAPLDETPMLIAQAVAEALEIVGEMREAGELPADSGYDLRIATVDVSAPVPV